MEGVVAITCAVWAVPLALGDVAQGRDETSHVIATIAVVTKQELLAGLVTHACAAATVKFVMALVFRRLDGFATLVAD